MQQGLLGRVKGILLTPREELPTTVEEPGDFKSLLVPYVLPLVALGAIASLIASGLNSLRSYGGGIGVAPFVYALIEVAIGIGSWWLLATLFNVLSTSFDGRKDLAGAYKAAAYALTPVWIAGLLTVLRAVPGLALVPRLALIGGLVYALFIGIWAVPLLLGTPEAKAVGHVLSAMAIGVIAFWLVTLFVFGIVAGAIISTVAS